MFVFDDIKGKKVLYSDLLPQSTLKHFFTTRDSVLTHKDLQELSETASRNKDCLADYLGIDVQNIIMPVQTHSDNIAIAKPGEEYPNTDALIVESSDIAICLNFADCTPVIIYDEKNNIGAIAHAGWRGTASRIAGKTVKFMQSKFYSKPENLTAIIGPAVSMKNYQVDLPVYKQLKATINNEYSDCFSYDAIHNKYNVDLKTINQHQLEELGVMRIDKCEYCTYDSVDVFFSYRRESGKTARHSAVLKLVK